MHERQARIERWMASHAVVGGIVTAVIVGSLTSHFYIGGGSWIAQLRDGLGGAVLGAIPWWIASERAKAN
jgi:outer membrane lipoprotein SlyB